MKVLLIYPPKLNLIHNNLPEFVSLESGNYPPLGIMYLAGYLEQNSACDVFLIDAQVEGMDYFGLEKRMEEISPDVVGIYASTLTLADVILTSRLAKKINPHIHVSIGGPHISIYPQEALSFDSVDSVIIGEGEEVFAHLLNLIKSNNLRPSLNGLLIKNDGQILGSKNPAFIEDLDSLPFPARHHLPFKKYSSVISLNNPITNLISSRGCPFNCLYCFDGQKAYRARTPKSVIDEIESCVKLGINEFFFFDDTFGVNRDRVLGICDGIIERGLNISWNIRTRVNTVDEEVLRKLKKAGCHLIVYGIEAGTDQILKVLRKGTSVSEAEKALRLTRSMGITSIANFMLGSPQEKREHILKTIDFAIKLDPDYAQFAVTTPYPGTDLYFMALEKGLFKKSTWESFAINPDKNFIPPLWEEFFTYQELKNFLALAYKHFYFRPKYVFRQMKKISSINDFLVKSKAALAMFRGTKGKKGEVNAKR